MELEEINNVDRISKDKKVISKRKFEAENLLFDQNEIDSELDKINSNNKKYDISNEELFDLNENDGKNEKTENKWLVKIYHWLIIEKNKANNDKISSWKNDCTIRPYKTNFWTKERIPPIEEYLEDKEYIYLPMRFGIKEMKKDIYKDTFIIIDQRFKSFVDTKGNLLPEFKIELSEDFSQISGRDVCVKDLINYGQATLCLPTGAGKTTTSVAIYCEICKYEKKRIRCLIIVNSNGLQTQLVMKIGEQCPDILIGSWKDKKVKKNPELYDMIVTTIQGVTQKDKIKKKLKPPKFNSEFEKYFYYFKHGDEFFSLFGMTLIDEGHHYSGDNWRSIYAMCNSRYILTLTATPKQSGGMEKCREIWTGVPSIWKKKDYKDKGIVKFFEPKYEKIPDQWRDTNTLDKIAMTSNLCEIEDRNTYIAKNLVSEYNKIKDGGGILLVLGERVEKIPHMHNLRLLIKEIDPSLSCIVHGGKERHDLEEFKYHHIVLSTFCMFAEYLDCDKIAAVAIITSNIQQNILDQCLGRGSRFNSLFGKMTVLYFADLYSFFKDNFKSHLNFFIERNFQIEYIDLLNPPKLKDKSKPKKQKQSYNPIVPEVSSNPF
jgi:hypothetical protein